MKQIEQIANIVNSGFRVAVIESARRDTIVDLFEQYGDYYGQGVYVWEKGIGLQRLGLESVTIAGTRSLKDALKFISTSIHFGIYLIRDFPERRSHRVNVLLRQIAESERAGAGLVALLAPRVVLEPRLEPKVLTVACGEQTQPAPVPQQAVA